MKNLLTLAALHGAFLALPVCAEVYAPTVSIGEFLRQFEKAYRAGDSEWIRSAVDQEGIIQEAAGPYFGFLGPKQGGETITHLVAVAAPEHYRLPNTLLDVEIEPTLQVDFILTFSRTVGGLQTDIKVPAGYRAGHIWLAGIKKK